MQFELITSELSPELSKQAKEVRLKLVKVRTGIADIHKTQKAFFLSCFGLMPGKTKKHCQLSKWKKKLENYYVNLEKERIAKLQIKDLKNQNMNIPFLNLEQ